MDRRKAGAVPDIVEVDAPSVDGEPTAAHFGGDEILGRMLRPAHRREFDELRRQRDLVVEPFVDRVHDLLGEIGLEHWLPFSIVSRTSMPWRAGPIDFSV